MGWGRRRGGGGGQVRRKEWGEGEEEGKEEGREKVGREVEEEQKLVDFVRWRSQWDCVVDGMA